MVTTSSPFGGGTGAPERDVDEPFDSILMCDLSLGEIVILAVSVPSLESVRGVIGGVAFTSGPLMPFVSVASSMVELSEERADWADATIVRVLGSNEGEEFAGFERCAAWTKLAVVLGKGFVIAVCVRPRARNFIIAFPDFKRERLGQEVSNTSTICGGETPSILSSLLLL